ncbi:MAG: hypothetical protein AAGU01_04350 [Clostridiaceae bacterium]
MGLLNKVLNFINNSSNQNLNEVNLEKAKFVKDFSMDNKQGMYSPISQNRRHINILKYVLSKKLNTNNLKFKSLVVLANEKTILDDSEAPTEIKNCIVKYDNVISKLEDIHKKENVVLTLDEMNKIGQVLIKYNKSKTYNNIAKYSIGEEDFINDRDILEILDRGK